MDERVRAALGRDRIIDITTIGRRSGQLRRVEIWFHNIGGRIIITGTPGPRGWYANLLADPQFTFHVKGATQADLAARGRPITDPADRRALLSAPETKWYRDQLGGVEPLVQGSPLVEVEFVEE